MANDDSDGAQHAIFGSDIDRQVNGVESVQRDGQKMNGDAIEASQFPSSTGENPSATEKSYEEHSEIMDAVMNLAQAANAQAENQRSAVPTDPALESAGEQSKKRKATSPPSADAPGSPDHSAARSGDVGDQTLDDILSNSEAQLGGVDASVKLDNADTSVQEGDVTANDDSQLDLINQSGDLTGTDAESTQQRLLARNGRPLNTSKRAAQNRAAQRAFRARRDEYVRQVEERAKQLEDAQTNALVYKQRFDAALQLIEGLRADAQALRSSLSSVSDRAPDAVKAALDDVKERPMEDFELNPHLMPKLETSTAEEDRHQHNLNELSAVAAAAASAAANNTGDESEQA